jgi:hypothetical protein
MIHASRFVGVTRPRHKGKRKWIAQNNAPRLWRSGFLSQEAAARWHSELEADIVRKGSNQTHFQFRLWNFRVTPLDSVYFPLCRAGQCNNRPGRFPKTPPGGEQSKSKQNATLSTAYQSRAVPPDHGRRGAKQSKAKQKQKQKQKQRQSKAKAKQKQSKV